MINGARQSGKSTPTRLTGARVPGAITRLLDDPATLRAATDDPTGFVEHDCLMIIDEVQLAPELLRPIKVVVDLDPTPGRFLLTGSARILALRSLPDTLPGRMEIIELWPFSQGEISSGPDRFVDAAFARGPRIAHTSELRLGDRFIADYVLYSGQQTLPSARSSGQFRWTPCGASPRSEVGLYTGHIPDEFRQDSGAAYRSSIAKYSSANCTRYHIRTGLSPAWAAGRPAAPGTAARRAGPSARGWSRCSRCGAPRRRGSPRGGLPWWRRPSPGT